MLATGWHILGKENERWDLWLLHRSLTREEIGGNVGGMSRVWYPRSGAARKGERACPQGSWSWAQMKAQTALNMDERRQLEKRKNNSSATAPSSRGCRNTRVCSWGSGTHRCPVPWAQRYWGCEHHQGTTQRLLTRAELSHSKYENFTHFYQLAKCLTKLLSPVCLSKFSFQKVEHHCAASVGSHFLIKKTE